MKVVRSSAASSFQGCPCRSGPDSCQVLDDDIQIAASPSELDSLICLNSNNLSVPMSRDVKS